ncbi:MAG: GIY-YIG nuclease family protein [Cyanobacteria bacterium SBLK]|nr:GIY-YIG nuclease family protein [Cyanobacteria bacterium SBLK]
MSAIEIAAFKPQDIYAFSTVAIADVSRVGLIPAVYFALDAAKRCHYVGKADKLRDRLTEYPSSDPEKWEEFGDRDVTEFAYWQAPTVGNELLEAEKQWIQLLDPPMNDQHRPQRPPIIPIGMNSEESAKRLLEIRAMIKSLKAEEELLKANTVSFVEEYGEEGKSIEMDLGKISLSSRKTWQYSEAVDELQQQIKALKKKEEKEGIAKVVKTSVFPIVKSNIRFDF